MLLCCSYIHMILLPFEIINAFTFQSLIDALSEDLMVESWVSYKITWFGIISKHVWNPNSWLRVFTCILHILRLGSEPVKYKNAGLLLFPSNIMVDLIGCAIIMCQLTVDPESWFSITANITEIYIYMRKDTFMWTTWMKNLENLIFFFRKDTSTYEILQVFWYIDSLTNL
jgi:hypothetical protein